MPFLQDFPLRKADDEGDRKLLDDVAVHGFHVVGISIDGQTEPLDYAFTVGLYYSFGIPEAVLFGMRWEDTQLLLRNYRVWGAAWAGPFEGIRTEDLANVRMALRRVHLSWYEPLLGYARWFYRGLPQPFPCSQLAWPDRAGKFDDEPGCDAHFRSIQPDLREPCTDDSRWAQ